MAKSAISRQNRNSVPVPNRGGTGTHGKRQSVGTDTDQSGTGTDASNSLDFVPLHC